MHEVTQGFTGHGKVGVFYSPSQMSTIHAQDLEEMANLVTAQQAKLLEGDDEAEDLARDA
jgi:hypothetical protein